MPSAQVKSCVLLAGLHARGTTTVAGDRRRLAIIRNGPSKRSVLPRRRVASGAVTVGGRSRLTARDLTVPGDISSAAFWAALAAGTPGGDVTIEGVGLNPTRTGVLDILRRAGARGRPTHDR